MGRSLSLRLDSVLDSHLGEGNHFLVLLRYVPLFPGRRSLSLHTHLWVRGAVIPNDLLLLSCAGKVCRAILSLADIRFLREVLGLGCWGGGFMFKAVALGLCGDPGGGGLSQGGQEIEPSHVVMDKIEMRWDLYVPVRRGGPHSTAAGAFQNSQLQEATFMRES